MIKRIILENYMSHSRTEIEPAAGLTVLLGPNNCGKSAVVSALETLARNSSGDFMIRHDQKEARVTVETDDGHELVWRRKGATVTYQIDGREIGRLKGGVPDDLHDHLKLPMVHPPDGGPEFDVHIAQQKRPIFLLDESESRSAMFFSASSDAGRLLEIQDRHREKAREQKAQQKTITRELELLDRDLTKLAPIDDVSPLLEAAQKEFADAQQRQGRVRELKTAIDQIAAIGIRAHQCEHRARELADLPAPPALEDVAPLIKAISTIRESTRRGIEARSRSAALRPLRQAPEQIDPAPLEQSIDSTLASTLKAREARARTTALGALREPPELVDPAPLNKVMNDMDAASKSLFVCAQLSANIDRQITDARRKIDAWAKENPNCPICGSPIDAEILMEEGAHAHGEQA